MAKDSSTPTDQAGQPKDQPGTPDRLGPSGKEGEPRVYAENALDAVDEDEAPSKGQGSGRSD